MKKYIKLLMLLLFMSVFCFSVDAKADGNLHALVVCNRPLNKDSSTKIRKALQETKIPKYKVSSGNIKYYYYQVQSDSKHSTPDALNQAIDKAFKNSTKNDLNVLVVFGHGVNDGIPTWMTKIKGTVKAGITYYDLAKKLCGYNGKFIYISSQCMARAFYTKGVQKVKNGPSKILSLFAVNQVETAIADIFPDRILTGIGYGAFTKNPADSNKDGMFSVNEIYKYTYTKAALAKPFLDGTGPGKDTTLFQFASLKCGTSSKEITVGVDFNITATLERNPGVNREVVWKSDKPSIASVSKSKTNSDNSHTISIKGNKAGTATITAYINSAKGKCYGTEIKCKVTVVEPSIKVKPTELSVDVGKTASIKATVIGPSQKVTWKSSDTKIATVTSSGVVKGIKAGTATVTASANGKSAKCKIKVIKVNNSDVTLVDGGNSYTAFLKNDGTLWMCGNNGRGQYGNDSQNVKIPIKTMNKIKYVTCGPDENGVTAVIKTDNSLWMCGWNSYGQLGIGKSTPSEKKPIKVMSGVKDVSCGSLHTAIVKTDGTLWTCGTNWYGQLGDGSSIDEYTPVKIMSGVESVSCGLYHTAILKTNGSLWMCGYNHFGQLGNGNKDHQHTPIQIMSGVKAVSCGDYSTAVLKTDGTLWTFGRDNWGQLGDGKYNEYNETPIKVMSGVKSVSCGAYHTAVIKNDNTLWMFGFNGSGQFGNGTKDYSLIPLKIMGNVKNVFTGENHTAIQKTNGTCIFRLISPFITAD